MKAFTRLSCLKVIVACVASLGCAGAMANLVQNGGFESGDFTDWTESGWGVASNGPSGGVPNSGSYYAYTGCVGAGCISGGTTSGAYLSQTLSTTNGQTYTLTFDFTTNDQGVSNELDVLWDGSSVLDLGPGGTLGVVEGSGGIHSYMQYTVSGLSGSGSDTVSFLGRQDPGYDGLDDVSVNVSAASTSVPEPASLALVGIALAGLAFVRRKQT